MPAAEDFSAIAAQPVGGVLVLDESRRTVVAANQIFADWLPPRLRADLSSVPPLGLISAAHHGDFLDLGVGEAPHADLTIQLVAETESDDAPWFNVAGRFVVNASGAGRWVYWFEAVTAAHPDEAALLAQLAEQRDRAEEAIQTSLGVYQITDKIRRAPRLSALLLGVRSEDELFARVGSFLQSEAIHAEFVRILIPDRSGVLRTVYASCESCKESRMSPEGEPIEVVQSFIDQPGESRWIPLVNRDQITGVIELRLPAIEERRLSEVSVLAEWLDESLSTLAEMIALFHANVQLYKELESQARHDGLTGLHNRHDLREELDRDLGRAARESSPLSLIFIDLDHFKTLNDSFGHAAGDRVLTRFSALLEESFRDTDYLCRYGGDEFVVILPATGGPEAITKAERLLSSVRSEFVDGEFVLTLSVGVAEWDRHETGRELLRRADEAMYRAKRDGRDRAHLAETPLPRDLVKTGSTVVRKGSEGWEDSRELSGESPRSENG